MRDWTGRPVAVTGAGGFIGSHLAQGLVERGADVRALVHYNSRGDRGALEWVDPEVLDQISVVTGDLRDAESTAAAIAGCEVVFHLGALIAVPYSYVNPRSFFETNVLGSLNVAQACLDRGVARLVHTSTSEVYGSAQAVPIAETHPVVAQSPYAASKIGADKLVESFHRSFGLPVTTVRPFNTYGPRQSARAIVPTIVSQALEGAVVRLGSLGPRRDFTYVTDTVAGFLAVGESERTVGETVQLGTGADVSVGELVEQVGRIVGRELRVEHAEERVRPPASEVERLVASNERAAELAGWAPVVPLAEGLSVTVDWIASNAARYRPAEYGV